MKGEGMKTSYPELAGKKIKFKAIPENHIDSVIVVAVNYKDGITLVAAKNYPETEQYFGYKKNKEVLCLNRKRKLRWRGYTKKQYRKEFYAMVKGIKQGYINKNQLIKDVNYRFSDIDTPFAGKLIPCAFK